MWAMVFPKKSVRDGAFCALHSAIFATSLVSCLLLVASEVSSRLIRQLSKFFDLVSA